MSNTLIWQNRKCKIEDGQFWMSAVGEHDNYDVNVPRTPTTAICGSLPIAEKSLPNSDRVIRMAVIDDNKIFMESPYDRYFILEGNPCDGGRIYETKVIYDKDSDPDN